MRRIIDLTLLLILTFMGQAEPQNQNDYLERLMELSGLTAQVEQIPGSVIAGIRSAKSQLPTISSQMIALMEEKAAEVFEPEGFLNAIKMELKDEISKEEATSLLNWYESEIGKEITEAEKEGSKPTAYQDALSKRDIYSKNQPMMSFAQKIEKELSLTEMMTQLNKYVSVAIFTAISMISDPNSAMRIKLFKSQMESQMGQMRSQTRQMVLFIIAYTYQNIPLPKLDQYLEFNQRPETRKLNQLVTKGFVGAFEKSTDIFAFQLAIALKEKVVTD